MLATILSVGDELTLGQTVDTNSAWISQHLAAVGCDILAHVTVPDSQPAIERVLREAAGRSDAIIISGGIGPTEDDLTRQAFAAVLNQPLELNEEWLAKLKAFFTRVNRPMPESNKIQAMVPRTATIIDNPVGTACGLRATLDKSVIANAAVDDLYFRVDSNRKSQIENRKCEIFSLPGVPKEMKAMFTATVLPWVREKSGGAVILSRTLHTFGLGESAVAEKLGNLMARTRNPSVGTTVSQGVVSLRLNARFPNNDDAARQLADTEAQCRAALGDLIYGADDDTLPTVVAKALIESNRTVATAESCTGGLLAKYLTDISGSSAYFKQGWIVYSNDAKRERLAVPTEVLNLYGAVSEPVVEHLAKNARRIAKSDFAIAISGVAGPTGGTLTKPVGMVCISLAYQKPDAKPFERHMESAFLTRTFTFTGDREMVRDRAAKMALTLLRFHLLGKPLSF